MLNDTQVDRYSRQIILPEVGARGQEKLLSTTLVVVDSRDGQSVLPQYLAAAGIGRLTIWRPGAAGIDETVRDISALNPDCLVEASTQPFSRIACENLMVGTNPFAVVLPEETAPVAEQINMACAAAGTPLVWGCVAGARARLSVFDPRLRSGCRACAMQSFEDADDPALRPLAMATLASQLAFEAIRLALGYESPLAGTMLCIDVAAATVTSVPFASDPLCAVCRQLQ